MGPERGIRTGENAMSQIKLGGSCLCGAVRYAVSGEVVRFTHCHCSRCRKASGAGHATNLIVRPATLTWLAGESIVCRHKVPEAERFATCFCAECGSPLPRLVPQMDMVVVPAGSLDDDPGIRPQAHIFWDSRAEWSCPDGGLPVFAEYPPGVVAPK
jgi:hypothetical protein